jgi:flagellar basal body-associated protein FliL
MVNSKKMSKSSIAVIVLAILLALSMVLGLTGAWFTDKEDTSEAGTITFGKVEMKVAASEDNDMISTARTSESDTYKKVMPGDTITLDLTVARAEDSDDFYYSVIITIEGESADGKTKLTLTDDDLTALKTATAKVYCTADGDQFEGADIVLTGASYGNAWMEATVTISYEVRAIQYANISATQAEYALGDGWNGGVVTALAKA